MKRKIYVLPDEPCEDELKAQLDELEPPLAPRIYDQLISSYLAIRTRVRELSLEDHPRQVHQQQTISDGKHTITLVGSIDPPSLARKLLDFLGG